MILLHLLMNIYTTLYNKNREKGIKSFDIHAFSYYSSSSSPLNGSQVRIFP